MTPHSKFIRSQAPVTRFLSNKTELMALGDELCEAITGGADNSALELRVASCASAIARWRAQTDNFRIDLEREGWSDEDIRLLVAETSRLADILESAISMLCPALVGQN